MGHKARAINAPPDNGGKIAPIKITNEEFLKALAGEDWPRVPISWGENSWWVSPAGKNIGKPTQETSNYFTVSIFALAADGKFRRTKELFVRQFVFVIDDVGTKLAEGVIRATLPPPTYILETSPGNFQWGYKLNNGTDARAMDALVAAIVDDPDINPSLKDPGMKGVTRVARLPVGSNNKDKWKDAEGNGWPHVLHVWRPELSYSVEDLAFWLGVDLSPVALERFKDVAGARRATAGELEADPILKLFDMKEMLLDATPNDNGFVSIVCPWADEHSDSRNEAGYLPGSGGFKCHHGHCESRNMNDLREWIAQECSDEFSAAQAETLRDIFEASPIDWDAVARIAAVAEAPADLEAAVSEPEISGVTFDGDEPPAPERMLVKGLVPYLGVTFIGGQSGAGKTFLAVDLAVSLASGEPFFGRKVCERVGVVIVAAEGGGTIKNRVHVARNAKAAGEILPIAWLKSAPDFSKPRDVAAFIAKLKGVAAKMRETHGVRLGAVIFDTVAAAFGLEDENDNSEAARVVNLMNRLSTALGVVVIPIHHHGKSGETGLRGASAWLGGADVVLSVTGDKDRATDRITNRRLSLAKTRSGEAGPIAGFDLQYVRIGFDEDGEEYGAAFVKKTSRVIAEDATPKASRAARVYLASLETGLQDKGATVHPSGATESVFAVDREYVRAEFYRRWPATGDSETKRAASKQRAFRRAEDELSNGMIHTREIGAAMLVWLDMKTDTDPDIDTPL